MPEFDQSKVWYSGLLTASVSYWFHQKKNHLILQNIHVNAMEYESLSFPLVFEIAYLNSAR